MLLQLIFPKKSAWQDLGLYEINGNYYLLQMRFRLDNNKKEFRKVHLAFVNDYTQKERIYNAVLDNNAVTTT
jgi:hypothetical protein